MPRQIDRLHIVWNKDHAGNTGSGWSIYVNGQCIAALVTFQEAIRIMAQWLCEEC